MFAEVSCPVQNIPAFALETSSGQNHVCGNMVQVNKKTTVGPRGVSSAVESTVAWPGRRHIC